MTAIAEVHGAAEWRGGQLAGRPRWRLPLGPGDRAELLAALAAAQAAGRSLADISRDGLTPPALRPVLRDLAGELIDGRGFALVQGVPVSGLSEQQSEILSLGIGQQVGTIVPQGTDGAPVRHVRDQGADPASPASRSYQHAGRLGYHSDPARMVALLCLRPAKSGGPQLDRQRGRGAQRDRAQSAGPRRGAL